MVVLPRDHVFAGRDDLPLQVLDELPLLLLDEGHCLRDQTLDLCRSVDAHPLSGDTRATSLATVVQCVAGGLGVTRPGLRGAGRDAPRRSGHRALRRTRAGADGGTRVPGLERSSRGLPATGGLLRAAAPAGVTVAA